MWLTYNRSPGHWKVSRTGFRISVAKPKGAEKMRSPLAILKHPYRISLMRRNKHLHYRLGLITLLYHLFRRPAPILHCLLPSREKTCLIYLYLPGCCRLLILHLHPGGPHPAEAQRRTILHLFCVLDVHGLSLTNLRSWRNLMNERPIRP